MKEKLMIFLKGCVFGIANIIPGVSGGTMALTMGIYEDLIKSISNIRKKFKKSMGLLIPFGLGAVVAILLLSKVIKFTLSKYPTPTILFFLGLIIGGIPLITKNVKGKKIKPSYIITFLIAFGLVLLLYFMGGSGHSVSLEVLNPISIVLLFIVGIITAATMVIPGISGSMVLMLIGYYEPLINTAASLTDFSKLGHNIVIVIALGLGLVAGVILIAKLLEYLFKKHKTGTYYGIIGFLLASIIVLIIPIDFSISIIQILIGIVLFLVGIFLGFKLGDK